MVDSFFDVFFELSLIPMYFLIGVWGGPRRDYASLKFFIYTLVGSIVLIVGILALYLLTGASTFDMVELARRAHRNVHVMDGQVTDLQPFAAKPLVRSEAIAAG